MAYEQEIYKKVLNAFEAQRMVEASERKRRLFEVYEKCAEVKQIDEEIDRVGSGAALEILKDPQNAPAIADDLKESMQMLSAMRARALEKAGFARVIPTCATDAAFVKMRVMSAASSATVLKRMCGKRRTSLLSCLTCLNRRGLTSLTLRCFRRGRQKAGVSQKEAMEEALAVCKSFVEQFDSADYSLFSTAASGLGKRFCRRVSRKS